jgi:cbb3-type cytochrome c oxidase subunit III
MSLSLRILSVLIWAGAVAAAPAARAGAPDGAAIYKQKCSMCHGVDGKGFSAIHTPDFTDPKVQASMTDKQMEEVIKNGKKGTAMPAFGGKLKDDEIQAVIKYLRSLNSEKKK